MPPSLTPVLLSGGRGSRLWPLSRREHPKQIHALLGAETMVQATAGRLKDMPGVTAPIVVCGVDQAATIEEQLSAVGCQPLTTIAEPVGRNTAAAITAAALVAPPGSILVVLPSDHVVGEVEAFRRAVAVAHGAALEGKIVTFGVVPTREETGYGYIQAAGDGPVRMIVDFAEKPDAATAAQFVAGKRHFWNAGMFVFQREVVLEQLRTHAPDVIEGVHASLAGADGRLVQPGPDFARVRSVSFDVAVMEKTDAGAMVPLDAGWDDVGSWLSVWEVSDRDGNGNALVGDVVAHDTHRSYLRSAGRPVVVLGLDEVTVVDAGDVIFVASLRHAQDVRELVERLDDERPELT